MFLRFKMFFIIATNSSGSKGFGIYPLHGHTIGDIDVVEINEAFAAQVLACERALRLDRSQLNPQGGAIALGHPLGSSGSRIVISMLGLLERTGGRFGIAALCIGVGQGAAMLIERL